MEQSGLIKSDYTIWKGTDVGITKSSYFNEKKISMHHFVTILLGHEHLSSTGEGRDRKSLSTTGSTSELFGLTQVKWVTTQQEGSPPSCWSWAGPPMEVKPARLSYCSLLLLFLTFSPRFPIVHSHHSDVLPSILHVSLVVPPCCRHSSFDPSVTGSWGFFGGREEKPCSPPDCSSGWTGVRSLKAWRRGSIPQQRRGCWRRQLHSESGTPTARRRPAQTQVTSRGKGKTAGPGWHSENQLHNSSCRWRTESVHQVWGSWPEWQGHESALVCSALAGSSEEMGQTLVCEPSPRVLWMPASPHPVEKRDTHVWQNNQLWAK